MGVVVNRLAEVVQMHSAHLSMLAHEEEDPVLSHCAELVAVLRRVLEGKDLMKAFGAPGDWGYGTYIGKALVHALNTLPSQHPDDAAVDRFAAAMKAKLARARDKGRSGWDDPSRCSDEFLATELIAHLDKGNEGTFEDIANFCMMLHQRKADPGVFTQIGIREKVI